MKGTNKAEINGIQSYEINKNNNLQLNKKEFFFKTSIKQINIQLFKITS